MPSSYLRSPAPSDETLNHPELFDIRWIIQLTDNVLMSRAPTSRQSKSFPPEMNSSPTKLSISALWIICDTVEACLEVGLPELRPALNLYSKREIRRRLYNRLLSGIEIQPLQIWTSRSVRNLAFSLALFLTWPVIYAWSKWIFYLAFRILCNLFANSLTIQRVHLVNVIADNPIATFLNGNCTVHVGIIAQPQCCGLSFHKLATNFLLHVWRLVVLTYVSIKPLERFRHTQ